MLYRLRLKGGGSDPYSAGSITNANGVKSPLTSSDFAVTPLEYWESPGGTRYPVLWQIDLAHPQRNLLVSAMMHDQELTHTIIRYWEGAVEARDLNGDIAGHGYLEMTGY